MNTPLCLARVLMFFALLSAPVIHCLAQPPVEPSWNGKYLTYYLGELKNPNPVQRQLATEAIGKMGSTAAAAVPELTKMLESKESTDRIAAAFALAKIGEASKPALPQLQKMATGSDENERKVALQAIDAIDPPASAAFFELLWSPVVMSLLLAVLAGAIVGVVLWRRSASKARDEKPSARAAAGPTAAPDISMSPSTTGETDNRAGAPPAAAQGAGATAYRKRVSRQLPGMESYVQEHEGPDTVKRELGRVQEEYKRLCEKQQDLAKYFNSEELVKDPERLRKLRLESDELALMHYKAEVRLKGLEVKMLEMLIDSGGATDLTLRERTETTIRQKWADLRTLCETPAKISWKGEQWVSVATGPSAEISDLRIHLASFGVVIGERLTTPLEPGPVNEEGEAGEPTPAGAEAAGSEPAPDDVPSANDATEAIAGDPPASEAPSD